MKTYSTLAQVTSRILAVVIVAIPFAILSFSMMEMERDAIAKMSHPELLAHVREGHAQSGAEEYLLVIFTLALSVGVVEAVAFVIRWVFGLLTADADSSTARAPWEAANGSVRDRTPTAVG